MNGHSNKTWLTGCIKWAHTHLDVLGVMTLEVWLGDLELAARKDIELA